MGSDKKATSAMPWTPLLGSIREYAIFTLDAAGVIDSWNRGVLELLGYDEQEFVGQPGSIIFTDEDRAKGAIEAELKRAREDSEAMDDRWHLHKDGSRLWVNGIMHAVRDQDGDLVGYLKIMRDQTEKRAAGAYMDQQQTLITAILDSLPGVFYMYDGHRYLRWNDEFERVTGFSAKELAEATPEDLVVESELAREHFEDVLRSGGRSFEANLKTKDGRTIPYHFTSKRVMLDRQPIVLGLGIENLQQVRSRALLERRAREQAAFAELAAARLTDNDVPQVLELAARLVRETLGAEHARITGLSDDAEPIAVAGGSSAATRDTGGGRGGDSTVGRGINAPISGHDGTFGYLEARAEDGAAFSRDDLVFVEAVANLLAGAVEQRHLHEELERRAETDDLTGLLKRVAFEHRLAAALGRAERQETKVAVLFIDLDRFKQVNDSLGHLAGDEVLKEVSRRLLDSVRNWDAVARHGGDEFVLFLPDINDGAEITSVAERLYQAFQTPITVGDQELSVGATIGIATYPEDGQDVRSLLRAADVALYQGKDKGRNRINFFGREKI